MCKSPRESPISTYLIFDEILLGVLVEEPNLEDDVGVEVGIPFVMCKSPRESPITAISTYSTLYLMRFSSEFLFRTQS
jgi:hypothetical protein